MESVHVNGDTTILTNTDRLYTAYVAKCNTCVHNDVCRYRDNYYKILREIERTINEKSYDNMFKLSLDCSHYKVNHSNTIYNTFNVTPTPCITNYPNNDNIYKTTLGDSYIQPRELKNEKITCDQSTINLNNTILNSKIKENNEL